MERTDNNNKASTDRETHSSSGTDHPKVRGTAVGGQYISPAELFTTEAGRRAIKSLIRTVELDKSRSSREDLA